MNIKMKKADQVTAIVLLLLSAFVIVESSKMALSVEFAPGYGFFPFWLGVLLAALSLMLLIDAWRRPASDEIAPFPGGPMLLKVTVVLAGLGLYAFLLEIAGYVLDTFLLASILLGVVEREKWYKTIAVAALITLLLYVIFQLILGVGLPKGPFGF